MQERRAGHLRDGTVLAAHPPTLIVFGLTHGLQTPIRRILALLTMSAETPLVLLVMIRFEFVDVVQGERLALPKR